MNEFVKNEFPLVCIVAISKNNIIGDGKELLWNLSGDLVRLKRNPTSMAAIIISTLNGNGDLDCLRADGVVCFAHESSLEIINESR